MFEYRYIHSCFFRTIMKKYRIKNLIITLRILKSTGTIQQLLLNYYRLYVKRLTPLRDEYAYINQSGISRSELNTRFMERKSTQFLTVLYVGFLSKALLYISKDTYYSIQAKISDKHSLTEGGPQQPQMKLQLQLASAEPLLTRSALLNTSSHCTEHCSPLARRGKPRSFRAIIPFAWDRSRNYPRHA